MKKVYRSKLLEMVDFCKTFWTFNKVSQLIPKTNNRSLIINVYSSRLPLSFNSFNNLHMRNSIETTQYYYM